MKTKLCFLTATLILIFLIMTAVVSATGTEAPEAVAGGTVFSIKFEPKPTAKYTLIPGVIDMKVLIYKPIDTIDFKVSVNDKVTMEPVSGANVVVIADVYKGNPEKVSAQLTEGQPGVYSGKIQINSQAYWGGVRFTAKVTQGQKQDEANLSVSFMELNHIIYALLCIGIAFSAGMLTAITFGAVTH
ncbi:MAG: hypothetical protein HY929_08790 [Euryarchaeota archaeon]|nr:hypothetical protein [Euryarchaeota archaeon]